MSAEAMRFKAKIKKVAEAEGIPAQVALQNFMFERFFARLSKVHCRENLVIKGGALISQYVGISRRTTMDIDATLRNLPLSEETVRELIESIFAVELADGISWRMNSVAPIRADDQYGGYRVKIISSFGPVIVPFSIDISSGDAITPEPEEYEFSSVFAPGESYPLKAYTVETVIAEKLEAILALGVLSTRPRDYYDVYVLSGMRRFDLGRLRSALIATHAHRGSGDNLQGWTESLRMIEVSADMQRRWAKYRREYPFAAGIEFSAVVERVRELLSATL